MKKVIRWLDINFEAFMGMIAFFTMLLIILCQIFRPPDFWCWFSLGRRNLPVLLCVGLLSGLGHCHP